MERYQWSKLNKLQVGAFTEYFVKMELTMYGFQVYTTEVDDRGIDFVTRHGTGPFLQIQVKSLRGPGYVYMQKAKFSIHDHVFLALGILSEGAAPELFLIPPTVWSTPNKIFVDHDFGDGLKSPPEWGINLSTRNLPSLQPYVFAKTVDRLMASSPLPDSQASTLR